MDTTNNTASIQQRIANTSFAYPTIVAVVSVILIALGPILSKFASVQNAIGFSLAGIGGAGLVSSIAFSIVALYVRHKNIQGENSLETIDTVKKPGASTEWRYLDSSFLAELKSKNINICLQDPYPLQVPSEIFTGLPPGNYYVMACNLARWTRVLRKENYENFVRENQGNGNVVCPIIGLANIGSTHKVIKMPGPHVFEIHIPLEPTNYSSELRDFNNAALKGLEEYCAEQNIPETASISQGATWKRLDSDFLEQLQLKGINICVQKHASLFDICPELFTSLRPGNYYVMTRDEIIDRNKYTDFVKQNKGKGLLCSIFLDNYDIVSRKIIPPTAPDSEKKVCSIQFLRWPEES